MTYLSNYMRNRYGNEEDPEQGQTQWLSNYMRSTNGGQQAPKGETGSSRSQVGSHEALIDTVADLTGGQAEPKTQAATEKETAKAALGQFSQTDILQAANDSGGEMLKQLFPQLEEQVDRRFEEEKEERRRRREEGALYGYSPEEKQVIEAATPQYTAAELVQAANDASGVQYDDLRHRAQIRTAQADAVQEFEQGRTDAELLDAYAAAGVKLIEPQMETAKRLVKDFEAKYPKARGYDPINGTDTEAARQMAAMMNDPQYQSYLQLLNKTDAFEAAATNFTEGTGAGQILDLIGHVGADDEDRAAMDEWRDERRAVQASGQAQHPVASAAGTMGGKMVEYLGGKMAMGAMPGVGSALGKIGNAASGALAGAGKVGAAAAQLLPGERIAGLMGDQILDVLFDTAPQVAEDVQRMQRQQREGLAEGEKEITPGGIALGAAGNFGGNVLFNLLGELPGITKDAKGVPGAIQMSGARQAAAAGSEISADQLLAYNRGAARNGLEGSQEWLDMNARYQDGLTGHTADYMGKQKGSNVLPTQVNAAASPSAVSEVAPIKESISPIGEDIKPGEQAVQIEAKALPEASADTAAKGFPQRAQGYEYSPILIPQSRIDEIAQQIEGISDYDARKELKRILAEKFQGNSYKIGGVTVMETPYELLVSGRGIKESLKQKITPETIAVLERMDEIIQEGKYYGSELDKWLRPNITRSDLFDTSVKIGDQNEFVARTRVNAMDSGENVLYYMGKQKGSNTPPTQVNADASPSAVSEVASIKKSIPLTGENIKPSRQEASSLLDQLYPPQDGTPPSVGAKAAEFVPEQKVSKVSSHTYADTPFLDDVSKNAANLTNIDPETSKLTYDVVTEKQSLKEAIQRTGTPELLAAEKADLPTKTRFDGTDTDTAMLILHDATERAKETGDWTEVEEWAKLIQERGTEAGQRIQAFAKYTRTPEGTVVKAERMVQQYVEELKKSDPKLFAAMQDLTDKLNRILTEQTASIPQDMDEAVRQLRTAVDGVVASSKLNLDADFTDELIKLFQEERLGKSQLESLLNEFSGVPEVTLDDIQQIMDIMTDAQKLPLYSKERQVIENQAYKLIADKFDTSFAEKWNAWRYMAMLGSPTTHIRNVAGNTVFGAVTRIKNDVGALLEAGADKVSRAFGGDGIARTKAILNPLSEADNALKQAAKDDFANVYALATGTGKKNPTRGILDAKTIFETPALEKTRTFISSALEAEDEWALKGAYADSLARWMKANGLDADALKDGSEEMRHLLDQGRSYAIQQAQEATFRDAYAMATALNNFSHTNTITNIFTEGILPFKKTPINIVRRGVEYSPVGLLRGIGQAAKALEKGSLSADEVIETLAKGMTGSGIMLLGAYLAGQGLLTGAGSDDKKEAGFEKLTGAQNYALTINGKSYTMDWMAPAALPLFVGAEIGNMLRAQGEYTWSDAVDALLKITEPVLDMTMLQGLDSAIQTAAYSGANPLTGILTNAATNYVTQGIPSLSGKLARTFDDTRRTVYTDQTGFAGTLDRTWQSVMNKIPGLSQTNQPYIDQWGREQENTGGSVLGRLAYNMMSPGYYSEDKTTPVDSILNQLYQETGDKAVLPSYASKTWTQDGERNRYTPEEYTQVSQARGQAAYSILDQLTPQLDQLDDEQAVYAVKQAYSIATELAKAQVVDAGLSQSTENIIDAAEDFGGGAAGIADILFAKAVTKDVEGEKYPNGKTISGSAKRNKIDALVAAGYTRSEALKLYELVG